MKRTDLRAACKVLCTRNDPETFADFRGLLIAKGEAIVNVALRNLDALGIAADGSWLDEVRYRRIVQSREQNKRAIAGCAEWSADWTNETIPDSASTFRARYPHLTEGATDAILDAALKTARRDVVTSSKAQTRRARHPKFGEGTIVSAEGDKLVIDFPVGRKTLSLAFVELLD